MSLSARYLSRNSFQATLGPDDPLEVIVRLDPAARDEFTLQTVRSVTLIDAASPASDLDWAEALFEANLPYIQMLNGPSLAKSRALQDRIAAARHQLAVLRRFLAYNTDVCRPVRDDSWFAAERAAQVEAWEWDDLAVMRDAYRKLAKKGPLSAATKNWVAAIRDRMGRLGIYTLSRSDIIDRDPVAQYRVYLWQQYHCRYDDLDHTSPREIENFRIFREARGL